MLSCNVAVNCPSIPKDLNDRTIVAGINAEQQERAPTSSLAGKYANAEEP